MQNNNRYSKYVALVALLISIVGVSLGFAAYSNTVNIKASADVTTAPVPPAELSTTTSAQTDGTITPTTTGATAEVANLNESTIQNIKVHFTATGQSAEYAFYAVNETDFTSYLNSVVFGTKSCTASATSANPATQGIADACEDINMTVYVGAEEYTTTDTAIDGVSITGGSYAPVRVVIEYISGGRVADGDIDVDFGTTAVTFSTVD